MDKSIYKLTVVVPVYNEADGLQRFNQEMNSFLDQSPVPTLVLFVNDGSTDQSQVMIEAIVSKDARYHFLQLQQNKGLSTALKAGIDYTETDWIGYIDADLQTSPHDFPKLIEFMPDYDMVTGIRTERKDTIVKKVSSTIANQVRRVIIHDGIEDTGCPLKIAKTSHMKKIPFFHGMHRFLPALIEMTGGTVKQVPVRHFPRIEGKAKYNLRNRLVGPFIDTLAFRWMQQRYIQYKVEKAV